MVTASHNPPQYNGVKLWNPDGSSFGSAQMAEVEDLMTNGAPSKSWDQVGRLGRHEGAAQEHIDAVIGSIGSASASAVLDCGTGATVSVSPFALRGLGCGLVTLNAQPDGFFPGRTSEPTEEALANLRSMVVQSRADLGIAHDGDGDRMVAVDDKGRFIDGDKLIALFATAMKARGAVAPMDASMALDEIVPKVVRCRVGDVYVAEALKESGLDFGGEPSGTYIFPKETYCPDGVYAGALLARMASESKLSEMVDALPNYPAIRRSSKFDGAKRAQVEKRLAEEMSSVEADRVLTLDGFRAETADGWFLIRLSGTEPKVRTTAEARDEEVVKKLDAICQGVVGRCLA